MHLLSEILGTASIKAASWYIPTEPIPPLGTIFPKNLSDARPFRFFASGNHGAPAPNPVLVGQSPDRNVVLFQHEDKTEDTAQAAKKNIKIGKVKANPCCQEIKGKGC